MTLNGWIWMTMTIIEVRVTKNIGSFILSEYNFHPTVFGGFLLEMFFL